MNTKINSKCFKSAIINLFKSTKGKAIAFGSVVVDDSITVRFNVYEKPDGFGSGYPFFIAWPSVRNTKGEFSDQAFPITAEAREEIYKGVQEALKSL